MDEKQNVCLFSRSRMELSGIREVESFTETAITLDSVLGMIAIEGKNLKIESFSAEKGELYINGEFDGMYYYGKQNKDEKNGFLSKLFK